MTKPTSGTFSSTVSMFGGGEADASLANNDDDNTPADTSPSSNCVGLASEKMKTRKTAKREY